jgi:hypothetical protein
MCWMGASPRSLTLSVSFADSDQRECPWGLSQRESQVAAAGTGDERRETSLPLVIQGLNCYNAEEKTRRRLQ